MPACRSHYLLMPLITTPLTCAGQMGTGIAQVAAMKGLEVVLTDSSQQALDRSIVSTQRTLSRLVAKEKITQEQAEAAVSRINVQNDLQVGC